MGKSPYCRHSWYIRNIFQWSKNDFKSKKTTNGDYLPIQNRHRRNLSLVHYWANGCASKILTNHMKNE